MADPELLEKKDQESVVPALPEKKKLADFIKEEKPQKEYTIVHNGGEKTVIKEEMFKLHVTLLNMQEDCGDQLTEIYSKQDKVVFDQIIELTQDAMDKNKLECDREIDDDEKKLCEKYGKKNCLLILEAANFLNNAYVVQMVCKYVAGTIRGKTTSQIREFWGIVNDFTKEEIEEIKKRHNYDVNN